MPKVEKGRYAEAAITILEEMKRPMTSRELVDEALRRGLFTPSGDNQAVSFGICLYYYIKRHPDGKLAREKGIGSKGVPSGDLMYALRGPTTIQDSKQNHEHVGADRETAKKAVRAVLTSMKQFLSQEGKKISEADTKANFIEPVIAALGWAGIGVVVREYYVKNSQEFIDYVLHDDTPILAIEAKSLHTELTEKAAAQIVQYCSIEGIEWAALTNGRELRLFNTFLKPDLASKLVLQLDLRAFNNDEEYDALFDQLWILSHESMTRPTGAKGWRTGAEGWLKQKQMDHALRAAVTNPGSAVIKLLKKQLADTSITAEDIVAWFRSQLAPNLAVLSLAAVKAAKESAATAAPQPITKVSDI